jgi:hypothetical protein
MNCIDDLAAAAAASGCGCVLARGRGIYAQRDPFRPPEARDQVQVACARTPAAGQRRRRDHVFCGYPAPRAPFAAATCGPHILRPRATSAPPQSIKRATRRAVGDGVVRSPGRGRPPPPAPASEPRTAGRTGPGGRRRNTDMDHRARLRSARSSRAFVLEQRLNEAAGHRVQGARPAQGAGPRPVHRDQVTELEFGAPRNVMALQRGHVARRRARRRHGARLDRRHADLHDGFSRASARPVHSAASAELKLKGVAIIRAAQRLALPWEVSSTRTSNQATCRVRQRKVKVLTRHRWRSHAAAKTARPARAFDAARWVRGPPMRPGCC